VNLCFSCRNKKNIAIKKFYGRNVETIKKSKKRFDEIGMTNFERKEMGVTGNGSTGS
jgi:hypothetical protein